MPGIGGKEREEGEVPRAVGREKPPPAAVALEPVVMDSALLWILRWAGDRTEEERRRRPLLGSVEEED